MNRLTDAILDLASLVPNPPHPTFQSSKPLEWAVTMVCEPCFLRSLTNVSSGYCFAPKTRNIQPILNFQTYD